MFLSNGFISISTTIFVAVIILFSKGNPRDPYWNGIKKLKDCGFNPVQTIDIGANVGSWARDFHTIFPQSKILMIEGNKAHTEHLQATGFPFEIALLSSHHRNLTFYVGSGAATGSTVFKENSDYSMTPVTVTAVTVDEVLEKHQVETAALLKIDIQGSEVTPPTHTLLQSILTPETRKWRISWPP
jgi:FkbM family methyltransferase